MKRSTLLALAIVAVLALSLAGCGPSASSGGSSTGAPPVDRTSAVGVAALGAFSPVAGASLVDGMGAAGNVGSGSDLTPAIGQPAGGTKWEITQVGGFKGESAGLVQVGSVRVIVGTAPARYAATGVPFAAMSDNGGAFKVANLGMLVGKPSVINAVASSGQPDDDNAAVVAVGTTDIGTTVGTVAPSAKPLVLTSEDKGASWSSTATVPLPKGVIGAEMLGVAMSPHSSPYRGVLAVGYGWLGTAPDARRVALIWGSQDYGHHWLVIADHNFASADKNLEADFVASDGSTVVVAGTSSPTGPRTRGGSVGTQQVLWRADIDGTWSAFGAVPEHTASGRGTAPTALVARDAGGYLLATRQFDAKGLVPLGEQAAHVWGSSDGLAWTNLDAQLKGFSAAESVTGISEFGSRIGFFGFDRAQHSQVWVVSPSD